jgi:uncharacterized protein
MTDGPTDHLIPSGDPAAIELLLAVRGGDVGAIRRLIGEHPDLPSWRIGDRNGTRTPLHMVADWPGYFPRGPEIARLLIDAGADPNGGPAHPGDGDEAEPETPLHWAASSDDVAVAAVLIDGGADIEAHSAGPIAGPPLVNAVAYGCWQVARLLVSRGARIGSLWQAAALGDQARVDAFLSAEPAPSQPDLDEAFWQACHGGQRRMAEYLLDRGANIDATPDYSDTPPVQIAGQPDTMRQALVSWLQERGAREE